jgi:hypothetical protein
VVFKNIRNLKVIATKRHNFETAEVWTVQTHREKKSVPPTPKPHKTKTPPCRKKQREKEKAKQFLQEQQRASDFPVLPLGEGVIFTHSAASLHAPMKVVSFSHGQLLF